MKQIFQPSFSKLIVEINNNVVLRNSQNNYGSDKIVDGETNSIKICQILDGLEISISGMVKTDYEFKLILDSFIKAIKPLRFKLSNLGAIYPASIQ